jgi:hypothetical protein
MKVLYTVSMSERHAQEAEFLTRMIKDAVQAFNTLLNTDAELEPVRFLENEFHEGGAAPKFEQPN